MDDQIDVQPKLSIHALGPVQVFRDEHLLTGWKYLDAAELLFFLVHNTRKPKSGSTPLGTQDLHGKTREQIGLALWPDASPEQLKQTLKSRLYNLRQVLGNPNWIIYENEQYKFNATWSYEFDVETFEAQVVEGERLRAQAPARAVACFQQAV